MHSDNRRLPLLAIVTLLLAFGLAGSCAHSRQDQKLVGDPLSPETRRQITSGRDQMIGAMASFIEEVDRDVCRSETGRVATRHHQQAMSEAYLEVRRAIEKSARAATPETEREQREEIVWMNLESPGASAHPQLRWQCRNATEHAQCLRSTANSVARLLYRSKFEGYALEAERMADLLETAGDDLEWALGLAKSGGDTEPGELIARRCRAGNSPLRDYLHDHDDRALRDIRAGFVGDHEDFCAGLAATYVDVIESLRAHFEQSLISQRCPVRAWSPLED